MRPRHGLIALTVPVILFPLLLASSLRADDAGTPKTVPRVAAEQAAKHIGEKVAVEMHVKSSRYLAGPGICFLNSCKYHRDAKNFTAVIMERGLAALKATGVNRPAKRYRGKKIRVTGRIELYQRRPQIMIETAKQIMIIKPKKKGSAGDKVDDASSGAGGAQSP